MDIGIEIHRGEAGQPVERMIEILGHPDNGGPRRGRVLRGSTENCG
jgi:hypothetical protein